MYQCPKARRRTPGSPRAAAGSEGGQSAAASDGPQPWIGASVGGDPLDALPSPGRYSGTPTSRQISRPPVMGVEAAGGSSRRSARTTSGGDQSPLGRLHQLAPDRARPSHLERAKTQLTLSEYLQEQHGLLAELARQELADIGSVSTLIDSLTENIVDRVHKLDSTLLLLPGCAELTAAKLISEVANMDRFRSEAAFTRYVGIAPVPSSSGSTGGAGAGVAIWQQAMQRRHPSHRRGQMPDGVRARVLLAPAK